MSTTLVRHGQTTVGTARSATPHSVPDFASLLGANAWSRLPAAVRARFGSGAHAAQVTVYAGNTVVRASIAGRALAQLCRCIGTPVAPYVGESVPLQVRVYRSDHGIVWERRYAFAGRDCVVKSTKQLDGNALVEKLGAGLYMRLRVFEAQGALHFESNGYFFRVGQLTLRLPDWFLPGGTHVTHSDLGDGCFRFTMRTHHPWLGELFFQDGIFSERG
jgi:hypothetical protein